MPTLDWLNRADAFTTSNKVPSRLLEKVSTHGVPAAGNLLIQGDNRPGNCNVLIRDVLAALQNLHARALPASTPLMVCGESVRVGPARLAAADVTFRQIPYDVRAR